MGQLNELILKYIYLFYRVKKYSLSNYINKPTSQKKCKNISEIKNQTYESLVLQTVYIHTQIDNTLVAIPFRSTLFL